MPSGVVKSVVQKTGFLINITNLKFLECSQNARTSRLNVILLLSLYRVYDTH